MKALVPNLTLMDVSLSAPDSHVIWLLIHFRDPLGQEVRRVITKSSERERLERGCRKTCEGLRGNRWSGQARVIYVHGI